MTGGFFTVFKRQQLTKPSISLVFSAVCRLRERVKTNFLRQNYQAAVLIIAALTQRALCAIFIGLQGKSLFFSKKLSSVFLMLPLIIEKLQKDNITYCFNKLNYSDILNGCRPLYRFMLL